MRARTVLPAARLYRSGNERFSSASEGDFIFYRKNLPGWERAIRVVAGLALIAWGLLAFPAAPLGYANAAGGATAILTGFFGFCSMSAMVGRKLPST